MKIIINNSQTQNKELCYEEGFWTGKKTITYNGVLLKKIKRNVYEYKDGEITEQFEVKGNQLFGITIKMFGQVVEVARKASALELVLMFMVFVPCLLFGAIGGFFGAGLGVITLTIIRRLDKWWLKLIVGLEFMATALLLSYIFAFLVLKTFMKF